MLNVEAFKTRTKSLWESQKRMAAPKKWKSGKRAGSVRREAIPIEFTEYEFRKWLWEKVGLGAIPCPYCGKPIDILSLTPDHVTPRSAGGRMRLDNMQCICTDCNERKGNFSARAFEAVLKFLRTELGPYDQNIMLQRLKAANKGSGARFFRDKKKGASPAAPAKPSQPGIFELPEF